MIGQDVLGWIGSKLQMPLQSKINWFGVVLAVLVGISAASGQTGGKAPGDRPAKAYNPKATAAFAEVALKRAEMEAELESLLLDYTDEYPRLKELIFSVGRIKAESERLTAIPQDQMEKATVALGKLIVRKIEAEVELWKLQQSYADGHPEVKRAKKRVDVFEAAIKEILG